MVNFKLMQPADLKEYANNPRKNEKAVPIVAKSIAKFGFLVPIVVDEKQVIVCGHTRVKAYPESIKLLEQMIEDAKGKEKDKLTERLNTLKQGIPAIFAEGLTESELKTFRIMDNKSQEYALWDQEKLSIELHDLMGSIDLSFTGFKETEMNRIMNPSTLDSKGDKIPKYKIEQGKVYKLGKHRLMCGDSTKEKTYLKLIPPNTDIHLIYTDPPYGVSYSGTNNENGRDWQVIEGDDLRGDKLYDFLFKAFQQMNQHLITKGALYTFHASSNQIIFEKALNNAGFQVKQQLIWHKHHILGHSDYHWTHEPIFYCSRIGENPIFYGERINKTFIELEETDDPKQELIQQIQKMDPEEFQRLISTSNHKTVVQFKKDSSKDYVHPTQKPVKMAEYFLLNSSKIGDNVLEPFAGSGSTLLACENKNRKCYAIEFSEEFCSHIIERWENLTNEQAKTEQNEPIPLNENH